MKMFMAVFLATGLFCLALLAAPARAAYVGPFEKACSGAKDADDSPVCKNKDNTNNPITGSNGIILKVTNLVSLVAGIAAVFVIIFSGIQFILSNGDSAKVGLAKDTILYSVIGLVVIVLARTIIVLVVNRL